MLRKLFPLFASLVLFVLLSAPASAQNASCCVATTSRLDTLMNPAKGSDEKFFSRPGGPPNVVFMVDTSATMNAWPRDWSDAKGCGFLDDLGYVPSRTYPTLVTGLAQTNPEWFNKNKIYNVPGGNKGYGANVSKAPDVAPNTGVSYPDVTTACNIPGSTATDQSDCATCLAQKGYYTFDAANRRVTGNFLNFYAPRDISAVKVLAETIRDLREVRFSIVSYGGKGGCWTGSKVCLNEDMKPTCDKSYPLDGSNWESSRNSILNSISAGNMFTYSSTDYANPLEDALYATGYYLSNNKSTPLGFDVLLGAGTYPSSNSAFTEGGNANFKSICFECSFSAVILLTGSDPSPGAIAIPDAIKTRPVACANCGATPSNLHKLADFLWKSDLRAEAGMAGSQKVATYVIGFSEAASTSALLRATTKAGGGKLFSARSTGQLKDAILAILDDVGSRNTTFSSSAITSLQVQTSTLTAVVPKMQPSRNEPWTGKLYRFEQFNEFVQEVNRNGDQDQEDLYLTDRDGDVVTESPDGDYYKATFDATGATVRTATPATPFWEANEVLAQDPPPPALKAHETRSVWTVVDSNNDGAFTHHDQMVEFKLSNLNQLKPYLGLSGAPECPDATDPFGKRGTILDKMSMDVVTAAQKVGVSFSTPTTQAILDDICARVVIQYLRGQDLMDQDSDGDRDETRENVLGDIFHSSPVIVEAPADKFLCDLGVVNQCARTLYSTRLGVAHTPLNEDATHPRDCTGTGGNIVRDAYDKYNFMNRKRERIVLVGANDGMLHAFSDGLGTEPSVAPCEVEFRSADSTGKEVWAFIPPDLLPRLFERIVEPHRYFVDGDIMVREVWAGDLNNNGKKDAEEYKVMAVAAEGRGGNHYIGVEVQWDIVNGVAKNALPKPGFRWMFPQPCTEEATRFGKTLYSLSPKAPPIGPVLLESTTGVPRYGKTTTEKWVVTLSGGWSPASERGRGIYMVDVWNGQPSPSARKDNLLWKWEFNPSPSGPGETQKYMTDSIVAPVSMVDYGANDRPRLDGFFDTAVVGDLGGQLWTFRFYEPGQIDSASGLVTNWSGGRTFQMDRDGVSLAGNNKSVRNRAPIHYLASMALQPDTRALRAFIGTGNRYSVLDEGAGICRFDNPLACSKLGCSDTIVDYKLDLPSSDIKLANFWKSQYFDKAEFVTGAMPLDACGPLNTPDYIKAEFPERKVVACPSASNPATKVDFELAKTKVDCGRNAEGVFACRVKEAGNVVNMSDLLVHPTDNLLNLGKNRYYGVWVYGGKPERIFKENALSAATDFTAKEYDDRRLTDTGGGTGTGDLVNVSSTTCTAAGACTGPQGAPRGAGWFFEYEGHSHKTGTGSAVIASCVLWNSVHPSTITGTVCATPASAKARLFQGDFITGAPNCAAGFNGVRFLGRDVVAPPTEPSIITQISKSGAVQVGAMVNDGAGGPQKIPVTVNPDLLQSVYELPVSRALHDCRHNPGGECAPLGP